MSARFQDKVVIVTGASSGIGLETALAFARAGAGVVLVARTQAKLQVAVDAHPDLRERLHIVPADVTKDEDVRRFVATTIAKFGRVDILINNAGHRHARRRRGHASGRRAFPDGNEFSRAAPLHPGRAAADATTRSRAKS